MAAMKISQFLRPLTALVLLRPKFFHPIDLGRPIVQFQTNPHPLPFPLQIIISQLKENII